MAIIKSIETGIATKTSTGVEGGVDVCFDATLDDDTVLSGEVTLLPAEDGSGFASGGAPDNWLDGLTLAALKKLDHDDFRAALEMIAGETAPVAPSPSPDAGLAALMDTKNTNNLPDGTLVSWNAGKEFGRTCGPARLGRKQNTTEYMVQPGFYSSMSGQWKFGQYPIKLMPGRNLTVVDSYGATPK